jgi:hypothetical protein
MANMPLDDIMIGIDHERTRVDVPPKKWYAHWRSKYSPGAMSS